MVTDQPRDLAAEVERVATFWGDRPEIKTLLQHIAALSRELEEHREALRWATEKGVRIQADKYGAIFSVTDKDDGVLIITPPAHLRAVLAKAMEGK